jgi:hypothetical protein
MLDQTPSKPTTQPKFPNPSYKPAKLGSHAAGKQEQASLEDFNLNLCGNPIDV